MDCLIQELVKIKNTKPENIRDEYMRGLHNGVEIITSYVEKRKANLVDTEYEIKNIDDFKILNQYLEGFKKGMELTKSLLEK